MEEWGGRIIGRFTGKKDGPLVFLVGGIHGNEPAGVDAIRQFFSVIDKAAEDDDSFHWCGTIIGLKGNIKALEKQVRFIDADLNRGWTSDVLAACFDVEDDSHIRSEETERMELWHTILTEIDRVRPSHLCLLDLHTTSAGGAVFSIPGEDSTKLAVGIGAPLVLGLLDDLSGTFLEFFCSSNVGLPVQAVAYEGGLHSDPQSVNRCLSAMFAMCRLVGADCHQVLQEAVAPCHAGLQAPPSPVVKVVYTHKIQDATCWKMVPGFRNFSPVSKGDLLAKYNNDPVFAPMDGYLLMPLYQAQGTDGFFIVIPDNVSSK